MKNILRITGMIYLMIISGMSYAQSQIGDVRISKPVIDKDEEIVTVNFKAKIGNKAVKRNYSLVFGPELTNGKFRWSLPVIIVQGKGSKVSLDRQIFASGNEVKFNNAMFCKNGEIVEYAASVPYQKWMEGATLTIEALNVGCCSSSTIISETLVESLILQSPVEPTVVTNTVYIEKKLTTGENLTHSYPFVTPIEMLDEFEQHERLFNEDREGTIVIHYAQSRYDVVREFGNNGQALTDLMTSIRILENSVDSEVAAVLIGGFASPEGAYDFNDKLAWNRAVSVKEYIMNHSDLTSQQIRVYNGSEDWQGLRMLVEGSNMEQKQAVLDIIDNIPIWDPRRNIGRLGELMRLDEGRPYRYMYEHYFPLLRNSAYIRVYYRNKELP